MSLFGMMSDLEEDPIFGHHMRSMRQMSSMLNSLFSDPFGGMMGGGGMEAITAGPAFGMRHNAMMPFMPPTMNRLLSVGGPADGASFSSSSVISMTSGPNGPQVYQATSSTRTGPGGIKETRKTVQDSRTGTKKMAIGHHIGDRAHIIEREQNVSTGVQEERQDFINLDDEEAEDFDREFQTKARNVMGMSGGGRGRAAQLALPSTQPTQSQRILSITEVPDNGCESCGNPCDTPLCAACSNNQDHSTQDISERHHQQQQQQQQHQQQHHHQQQQQQQQQTGATKTARNNRHGQSLANGGPITSRRSIRSPASSPLSMSASPVSGTNHHITTSVHPHPYNTSGRKSRPLKGPSSSHNAHYQ